MMKFNLALLLLLLFSSTLTSQIVTDRPDQTESSSTIPLGGLQIESGILVSQEGSTFSNFEQFLLPTTLFRYGMTKGVELRFLSQFEINKVRDFSFRGMSDIEVGVKIGILNNPEKSTEVAFMSHVVFPSGSPRITGDEYGTINKLLISHKLGENANLGYNIGYNYFGEGSGDLTYTLALGVGVNDKVGVYIEPYGELANMEEAILNFNAGFTYLVNPLFQLDFSFGTGITDRMNFISMGFSYLMMKSDSE